MVRLEEVSFGITPPRRLASVVGGERSEWLEERAGAARDLLEGRAVVNVNSTAAGGGVAELLHTLLPYVRGAGIDTRWYVIEGDPEFFRITKRIHNQIYGGPGDGGPLGDPERAHYERVVHENAQELVAHLREGDVVILHDPQPAGMAEAVRQAGAFVVWRCHIGSDYANEWTERGWEFVRRYVEDADALVFSHEGFAPSWVDRARVAVISPSLDPFSAKNEPMSEEAVAAVLTHVGLASGGDPDARPTFTRRDGSPGRIDLTVDVLQSGPPPPLHDPVIVQVSRWDRLKDMAGVMEAFAQHLDTRTDVHLLLVGPGVSGVADDPEGGEVLDECEVRWRELPHSVRTRVHIACIPMTDAEENAAVTNAIQRHGTIVTQKSLAEGFGLTVTEAMYKARPVVATRVGGIADQIVHGEHGLLVDDPGDLDAFGRHLRRLLDDPGEAARLGAAAQRRALDEYAGDRHLAQYAQLLAHLVGDAP